MNFQIIVFLLSLPFKQIYSFNTPAGKKLSKFLIQEKINQTKWMNWSNINYFMSSEWLAVQYNAILITIGHAFMITNL